MTIDEAKQLADNFTWTVAWHPTAKNRASPLPLVIPLDVVGQESVDSTLKDMAAAMKQLDRSEEAIEAINSFRHLCSHES
ncbi:hypothetical protein Tco_0248119 [Tanacetum coccineum]